jgi:DNA recombination protein RmuC
LRSGSQQRGKWGEFQLQRLAEMAGMQMHVDFSLQESLEDGRPDMVVKLPRGGCIPVDAKASMQAYLESLDAVSEDERKAKLSTHAQNIRLRVKELSERKYWDQFEHSPELVVMFVPNDACLGAAFEIDSGLVQYAFDRRVALATPISLFALLKAVAYGWQQHEVADNAVRILEEVKELARRFSVFADHFVNLGSDLDGVIKSYNETWGSYSSRLLPSMKRLSEMGVVAKPSPEGSPIEALPRTLELITPSGS